jgi:hypothetical protein
MKYYLVEACQNRFVLFDYLKRTKLNQTLIQAMHRSLIKEDRDDALILTEVKWTPCVRPKSV